MNPEEAIKYHSDRAMQELDLGIDSPSGAAAKAHLGLSALHMERARRHIERRARLAEPEEAAIVA